MSDPKNKDPFERWNGPERDDPSMPWNDPAKRDDPFAVWNQWDGQGLYRDEVEES